MFVKENPDRKKKKKLSTGESLGAMFNILLKQTDKQINYKVTSEIAISHDLSVELGFII